MNDTTGLISKQAYRYLNTKRGQLNGDDSNLTKAELDLWRLLNFKRLSSDDKNALGTSLRRSKLLSPGKSNAKTAKQGGFEYDNYILHLLPADLSGFNVCPLASEGCKAACLNTSGRGRFDKTQYGRLKKTLYFVHLRTAFMRHLYRELSKLSFNAVVRLNGTSDVPWERLKLALIKTHETKSIIELFPHIQFYDYTVIPTRFNADLPPNYHLTFSRKESNDRDVNEVLNAGGNVAIVFNKIPERFQGYRVIDGDKHDFRFKDPKGVIVGLKAKGRAKKDNTGFVIHL